MERLLKGVATFQKDVYPQHRSLFEELANNQNPEVLFITCADSRIVPDLLTQTKPGDLFICRNAGNMVPPHGILHGGVTATIEYAVSVLKVRHIIVCGHTDCGAMKALLHPEKLDNLPSVKSWLAHGEVARRVVTENYPELTQDALVHALTEQNVVAQIDHLRTHPAVAARLAGGQLSLHGWVYHIRTGQVVMWDARKGQFVPLSEYQVAEDAPEPRLQAVI